MSKMGKDRQFEALLEYLHRTRGFDFTAYKQPSLMRRINRRMRVVGIESYVDYLDYLEVHPDEFAHLFNMILINVTSFFRDEAAWEYLKNEIIPRIVSSKGPKDQIRVWCAGIASGEEAYSIAMLLSEAVGEERFRESVKIYATDIDDEALGKARQASYSARQVEGVPQQYLQKYFEQTDTHYVFSKDLRRSVIFGRHDLVQDAPISRIDLLICRNTLMYFNAEAQSRILAHFHFALNDDGILFLGKSEMLLTHTNIFTPLDLKRRVFTKVPRLNFRDRLLMMAHGGNEEGLNHIANNVRIREAAFDANPVAQIVMDQNGHLMLANQQARAQFGLTLRDMGRPVQDLEISYRPVELRSQIEQAYAERRMISLKEVEWAITPTDKHYIDVQVTPLITSVGTILGVSITFIDTTRARQLQEELLRSKQELETTYEELQSTVEELETTNEELQSTNEELETLNEELQSTNEELETMNEELQSTNEELETINEEMRQRTVELNEVNDFMESILTSLRAGVMVIDQNLRVQVWNRRAEDLWGLRPEETMGQHFLTLDIGLPLEPLKQVVRNCLAGETDYQEVLLEATNRRGRRIYCRVTCTPLNTKANTIRGAILLMEEREPA
ncbi:MAG TPA: CheR family methyltransferase [Blastocatellia bacterium]|nr:CheR family methyltransferase [Blastocatellia bacterium]